MPEQTYSVEEIGRRIRAKKPETFANFSDLEIGQKMVERHPELKAVVNSGISEKISSKTTAENQPEKKEGLLKSLAKNIVRSTAEVGTSAYNVGSSIGKLISGDVQGASRALDQKRNIPFIGETKPAFSSTDVSSGYLPSAGQAKKVLGYGLDIGTTILPVGGGASVLKQGSKGLIKEAVKGGAKYGAITGFGQGVAGELEKGDEGTLKEAAKQGVYGAAVGAPLGALTGFVGAKSINRIKNADLIKENKLVEDALSVVKPELNKKARVAALKTGKGEVKGLLKNIDINDPRDIDVANAVKGIVSSKKPVTENIKAVRAAIADEAQRLKASLQVNNSIFNQTQIQSKLKNHKAVIGLKSDSVLNNAYELTKKRLMEIIKNNPKNLTGLLDSRIEFDDLVERELGDIYKKEGASALKTAITDLRGIVNKYIAEKAPSSGVLDSLNKQSLMFRARDSMAEKGANEVKTNILQRFIKQHPTATKVGKYGATAVAGGYGVKAFTGE